MRQHSRERSVWSPTVERLRHIPDRSRLMSMARGPVLFPILLIALGTGWLLTTLKVVPGVDWIWILMLAVVGLLPILLGGLDRFSVPIAAFMAVCTGASLLRQTGRMAVNTEVPVLVIAAGVILLASRLLPLPPPRWLQEPGRSPPK